VHRESSEIRRSDEDRLLTGKVTCARFGEAGTEQGAVCPSIVSQSPAMTLLVSQADAVAKTDCTVLVTGESGVGKDVIARYIHFRSDRAAKKMVTVNCGAFTESLFEAEFFGYEKGAFTGANAARQGLLEAADESTLFLDEVADMAPLMQVKLLRFLDEGSFRRVGSTHDRIVNVRVIAATNKDLEMAVREGIFRADLYYRLNVISFSVPPLRERREELPELIEGFMTIFRSRFRRPALKLSHEARRRLQEHNWPGNVRELRNCLERACALSTEDVIEEERLGLGHSGSLHVVARPPAEEVQDVRRLSLVGTRMRLADLERAHILSILEDHGGNRERASAVLGISARTLYRKLREYEIDERAEEVA